MVICKCHKATQLYCFVHRVPVCGDCVCLPEHSICEVKTYSEWVVNGDGAHELSPKCSSCSEQICTDHPVIRLTCLHIFHTQCLLALLQTSPSATGYTCSSCKSQVWPPKQHLVNSSSALCKRIEEVLVKGRKMSMTSEPLLPLLSESFLNSSDMSTGERFLVPLCTPEMEVPTSVTSLATLYEDQSIPKIQVTNNTHSKSNFSAENEKNKSLSSTVIDIEPASYSSKEHVAKTVGSPKITRVLSRKSPRNDRKTNGFPIEEQTPCGTKYTPKGPQTDLLYSVPCSLPNKMILPVTAPAQHKETDSHVQDLNNGRWRRYRHSESIDPRKILFIFATLSSMGTILLIYFTLTVGKMGNLVQVENQ